MKNLITALEQMCPRNRTKNDQTKTSWWRASRHSFLRIMGFRDGKEGLSLQLRLSASCGIDRVPERIILLVLILNYRKSRHVDDSIRSPARRYQDLFVLSTTTYQIPGICSGQLAHVYTRK